MSRNPGGSGEPTARGAGPGPTAAAAKGGCKEAAGWWGAAHQPGNNNTKALPASVAEHRSTACQCSNDWGGETLQSHVAKYQYYLHANTSTLAAVVSTHSVSTRMKHS
jgi:hypothetical protein